MAQLAHPADPFGEVNVYRKGGGLEIAATILMEPDIEGARAGLALDGSASMKKAYGAHAPLGPLFAQAGGVVNVVEPVARTMAGYLAKFAAGGKVSVVYWACKPDGSGIEPLGEIDAEQAAQARFTGPRRLPWGRNTQLLPAVRFFVDEAFRNAPWAICVFLTDGIIEDLPQVKQYCVEFAKQIASGKRKFIKLVLLGVGELIDEGQMEELDDMFEGSDLRDPQGRPIDLWDHKVSHDMRQLAEIFAEVVSEDLIVAASGRILDDRGQVVRNYTDGLPALLRFPLPGGAKGFTLELPTGRVEQDITEVLDRV